MQCSTLLTQLYWLWLDFSPLTLGLAISSCCRSPCVVFPSEASAPGGFTGLLDISSSALLLPDFFVLVFSPHFRSNLWACTPLTKYAIISPHAPPSVSVFAQCYVTFTGIGNFQLIPNLSLICVTHCRQLSLWDQHREIHEAPGEQGHLPGAQHDTAGQCRLNPKHTVTINMTIRSNLRVFVCMLVFSN